MDQLKQRKLPVNIEDEMRKSYVDYAMSVIIGRAIPDVRDGLKPVHRRALFAMAELGNRWNRPYKKSARIVGDIIGKYHPHGDSAAYDTIVRMAQDFSMRYPLVDGQGNFGSIDGDPPAAMRYTEIRMARIAEEMLADIDKDTVDFNPTYDEALEEPTVLPAKIPELLLNGSSGIAVGVTTNIPPHNLVEVCDGLIALIENPALTVEELMRYIQGPDFPTAGFINGRGGIVSAYRTGRGIIRIRARALVERNARSDKESIVVTELPYMVNKASLIEKISALVKEKKINGITDLRDESDREGMRVVIDLKRDEMSGVILNQLYKQTSMESTFGIIMLAIDQGKPAVLNLKEILQKFITFRREVVTKRTRFDLARARERLHILEGLIIALDAIDEVVAAIRASSSPQEAQTRLIAGFGLTETQAKAILDMRLQRLTGLERDKIREEHRDIAALVRDLEGILADVGKIMNIIKEELEDIKKRFGDARRTEIVHDSEEIDIEDMIVEEDMAVTISNQGYIKRNPISLYTSQRRGGKGKMAMGTKDDDFVERIFIASSHSYILFFTNQGRVYWLKVYQIPQASRAAKGKAVVNLIDIAKDERVTAALPVRDFVEDRYVIMATRRGVVKKTDLLAYSNPRVVGIIALTLDDGDELIDVHLTDGERNVFLGTQQGYSIRFKETDVRPMGRTARGVMGIRMDPDDQVVGMEILSGGKSILTVSERGFGKRTDVSKYRLQRRGGKGIINLKTTPRVGPVTRVLQVADGEDVMLISNAGNIIRLKVEDISLLHRSTQGVKLIDLDPDERLAGLASAERDEESDIDSEETDAGEDTELEEDFPGADTGPDETE
ncbi:MAG: DNA gyrase subunit A [Syntrophales bacterium]|jgi:DNA gyrase subunit A|nr:DNA gyrase subunit A [Syntrophales bacterium]MCK9527179.1 DNA gyrase subunit A [Syntrophales bacterium]MDX9921696.1 DNA gyrase subunit A [Syntrophales bacterium]